MFRHHNRVPCGIVVITAGISVVFAMWLPPACVSFILGVLLIWSGWQLICRK